MMQRFGMSSETQGQFLGNMNPRKIASNNPQYEKNFMQTTTSPSLSPTYD